jgi:hypothetical protein
MLKLWSKFIVWYVRWLECPGVRKISSRECEQRQPNTSDFHRGKAVTDSHSAVQPSTLHIYKWPRLAKSQVRNS